MTELSRKHLYSAMAKVPSLAVHLMLNEVLYDAPLQVF